MTRKLLKTMPRRTPVSFSHVSASLKSAPSQRSHIFLTDPNVMEIKRALSPFWAWRLER